MKTMALERVRRLFSRSTIDPLSRGALSFRCNICGADNCLVARSIGRESGGCRVCRSNLRFRSLAAVLTQRLFGKIEVLGEIEPCLDIRGIGMSDHENYAFRLEKAFNYTNTFFHCEPRLDITKLSDRWVGVNDFVISSDVFEHVAPPVQLAFNNLFRMLKPGGAAVFTVPFSLENETREHFPNLFNYVVSEASPGAWLLKNVTRDGVVEEFHDLVFHGGPGTTLEMRLFSLPALKLHFEAAGFVDFRVHHEAAFEHGIFWSEPWSVTISALRPHA